jgi:hypothetical protein
LQAAGFESEKWPPLDIERRGVVLRTRVVDNITYVEREFSVPRSPRVGERSEAAIKAKQEARLRKYAAEPLERPTKPLEPGTKPVEEAKPVEPEVPRGIVISEARWQRMMARPAPSKILETFPRSGFTFGLP